MRRVVIILAIGALLTPAAVAARGPEAAPAPRLGPVPEGSDFDSDGFDDLAIGAPFDDVAGKAGAGLVNVLYGSPSGLVAADQPGGPVTVHSQVWHQDRPNVADTAEAGDRFGWALASGDFDEDGYEDLAIGVPNEDLAGVSDVGAVNILFGSPTGLKAEVGQLLVVPPAINAEDTADHFGFALAAGDFFDTVNANPDSPAPDGVIDLAIGVPGDGPGRVRLRGGGLLIHNVPGAGSSSWFEAGGEDDWRFGHALVAGRFDSQPFDDLAVGAPWAGSAGGSGEDSGEVVIMYDPRSTPPAREYFYQEASGGLGDVAETYDRLGESLAAADITGDGYDDLAIGVPHEDLGAASNAGIVHVVYAASNGSGLGPSTQIWSQDELPGTSEAGDLFGSSLAMGYFARASGNDLAIGVRRDAVGTVAGAGAVVALGTSIQRWHQNSPGVLDVAEANDQFGTALSTGDFDGDGDSDVAIGVAREDVGSIVDAGAVNVLDGSFADGGFVVDGNQSWHQDSPGVGEIAQSGDRFGSSFP